jgi:hypothetical protein
MLWYRNSKGKLWAEGVASSNAIILLSISKKREGEKKEVKIKIKIPQKVPDTILSSNYILSCQISPTPKLIKCHK